VQWQPETEQAENEPEQPRNVDARKQAGILMCGRVKCQGRFPQAQNCLFSRRSRKGPLAGRRIR
jgi:hypothetical protein